MPDAKNTPAVVSVVSGGIAGGVEAFATYPFEFAKTRIQLRNEKGARQPRNPFKVVSQIWREEGVRAMYRGSVPLAVGSVGKDAVRFLGFDTVKNIMKDPQTGSLTPVRNLFAGMIAGLLAAVTAVCPSERIKTALIDDARAGGEKRFTSSLHAIRVLYQEDGIRAFYRGLPGTALKQAGATAFRMGSYNILKDYESKRHIKQTTLVNFGNGAIAGLITTYATQPFDGIKTRSQSSHVTTTGQAIRDIYADGGIPAFWRGTVMRLGRTIFAGGILFTTAEAIGKLIEPVFVRS